MEGRGRRAKGLVNQFMSTMRAKFRVTSVESVNDSYQNVEMFPVTEKPYDKDGNSEDNSFSKWTPSGILKMSITNPALVGKIREGQRFYLDFTEVPE